jgi:hypothetical protein
VPGRERLLAKFKSGPAIAQEDFGNPLAPGGTSYRMCLFDDSDDYVARLEVDRAGDTCAGIPCWKAKGQGWHYRDPRTQSDAVADLKLNGGPDGKSAIQVGTSGHGTPVGMTAALATAEGAKLQVISSDAGCFEMVVDEVKTQRPGLFKAVRK